MSQLAALRDHCLQSNAAVPQLTEDRDSILDDLTALHQELDCRKDANAKARLAQLLSRLDIEPALLAQRLDPELLAQAELVTQPFFTKRGVQIRTARFFKQQNYNLLREQNEGFTALVTHILSSLGPVTVASPAIQEQESPAQRNSRAKSLISNIHALIGSFHLDPNRVQDILLDLFASNLTRHYPFLLAVLSASPWGANTAQLLAFKLANVDNEDLYYAVALLIRTGLVQLADIYPHLSPGEQGLAKLHTEYRKSLKPKSAAPNALSMAAPLDGPAPVAAEVQEAPPPPNQVKGLIRCLLALGDLDNSTLLLARYPWLCVSDVADAFIRLLKVIVKPAYAQNSPSRPSSSQPKPRWDSKQHAMVPAKPPVPFITRRVPEPPASAQSQPVFFFADWHTALPKCHTLPELLEVLQPLLKILGVGLWRDLGFFQQICRIAAAGIRTADAQRWLNILRTHLLPALSLSSSNSGLSGEIWMLVRQLPYEQRFALYGQWHSDLQNIPELRAAQINTERGAKGILKRISKDNLKQSGRNLAKAAHSSPTVFFAVALNQVQAYDNLIQPLVESAKYLSNFEYDIFVFMLIDALSNPDKQRTKQDGTNISQWLKSLAAFCGTLFRRYAMMDCTPVLQYLTNQLKANNSKDLVILSELITKMSGIEPLANLADAQIAALTGGRTLHMEAMMAANAVTGSKERMAVKRSGQRLLQALVDSKLAVPLLVLVAQQRQACIHMVPESEAHLKYLGNLYDSCQEVLLQYVEFLYNHLEPSAYAAAVPSLNELGVRFGIEPAIAFYVGRPRLVHSMKKVDAAAAAERLRATLTKSRTAANADTTGVASEEKAEGVTVKEDTPTVETVKSADAAEIVDVPMEGDAAAVQEEGDADVVSSADAKMEVVNNSIWHLGLADAKEAALKMLPEAAQQTLGVQFYVTFWQLSLADISVPVERYQQEIKRLGEQSASVDTNVAQLGSELKEQIKAHEVTRKRLVLEKDHWFGDGPDQGALAMQLIQYCLYPRALLSATDAILAGKFVRSMHTLGTRNFSSLTAYDRLLGDGIGTVIFSCTENEARNYARFLETVLSDLSGWHRSMEAYAKEGLGQNLPGLQRRWGNRHGGEEIPPEDLLTWEQFRVLFCKWQGCLLKAFRACLESQEYMQTRNAIVVMTRLAAYFPVIETHGTEILGVVESVAANEERGDLKILAQGLMATLKARKKAWVPLRKARHVPNDAKPKADTDTKPAPAAKIESKSNKIESDVSAQTKVESTAKTELNKKADPSAAAVSSAKDVTKTGSEPEAKIRNSARTEAASRAKSSPAPANQDVKAAPQASLPDNSSGSASADAIKEANDKRAMAGRLPSRPRMSARTDSGRDQSRVSDLGSRLQVRDSPANSVAEEKSAATRDTAPLARSTSTLRGSRDTPSRDSAGSNRDSAGPRSRRSSPSHRPADTSRSSQRSSDTRQASDSRPYADSRGPARAVPYVSDTRTAQFLSDTRAPAYQTEPRGSQYVSDSRAAQYLNEARGAPQPSESRTAQYVSESRSAQNVSESRASLHDRWQLPGRPARAGDERGAASHSRGPSVSGRHGRNDSRQLPNDGSRGHARRGDDRDDERKRQRLSRRAGDQ